VKKREEILEESHFLEACLNTTVMQCAFGFLVDKNIIPDDVEEFKRKLNNIWFKFYKRSVKDK
jgi:poly(U)-specific endoribonuclease